MRGAKGYKYRGKVTLYFGYPSGKEYYWMLDGKIAVENTSVFDKWQKAPFVC